MKKETMEKNAATICNPEYPGLIIHFLGGKFPGFGWGMSSPGSDTLIASGGGADAPNVLRDISQTLEKIANVLAVHTDKQTAREAWDDMRIKLSAMRIEEEDSL